MIQLLPLFGFVLVVLRAATLCFQSLVIGGIVFEIAVTPRSGSGRELVVQPIRRLIVGAAIALALTQAISAALNAYLLMRSVDLTLREVVGANFALNAGMGMGACLMIVALRAKADGWGRRAAMLTLAALLIGTSVMTSHAASSLTHRFPLVLLTALHQGAAATWIGGLPYLWIALKSASDSETARRMSQNFSKLAIASVSILAAGGLGLGAAYVGSWPALYGTTYGAMAAAKVLLFGFLLGLGGMNFRIVRRLQNGDHKSLFNLRRVLEAEIGFGVIAILTAASLTSQPPAVDLVAGRVSSSEIIARLTPRSPRLRMPDVQDLGYFVKQRTASSAPSPGANAGEQGAIRPTAAFNSLADREWAEYTHHWAGLMVLLLGLMALAAQTGQAPWARNWPLLFLGLAAFLLLRADPENWPLGPQSFWASFGDPEVLQHRLAVLLIIAFAIFEWTVRTGRTTSDGAALVFPAVCAAGGAVLLTHSHALINVKEELLTELNHLPLAILGVVAGWSRWLEIRLPAQDRVRPVLSWVWPICFILVGALLLDYREI